MNQKFEACAKYTNKKIKIKIGILKKIQGSFGSDDMSIIIVDYIYN